MTRIAPLLLLASFCHAQETVFFSDSFNRPDSLDLNTNSGLNQANFLGTPIPYVEMEETTDTTVDARMLVRLESQAVVFQPAAGYGQLETFFIDHNFVDNFIPLNGDFSVRFDAHPAAVIGGTNSLHQVYCQIGLSRGLASNGLIGPQNSFIPIAFTVNAAGQWGTYQRAVFSGWTTFDSAAASRTTPYAIDLRVLTENFNQGTEATVIIVIDGVERGQTSFTWSGAENYLSFGGIGSGVISRLDNLELTTTGPVGVRPVPLGTLDRFWRYNPVLGQWLLGGLWLLAIPDYMMENDFPYPKRPYPKEVPFADHLSVVRILGGWDYTDGRGEPHSENEADLVFRNDAGELEYRWHLLQPRIQQYIDNGYDQFTFVLDNTPWDLAVDGGALGTSFGQKNPPASMAEWQTFITGFATELVRIFGYETASNFRFRQGTENQSEDRFNGSTEDYLQVYDHTVAAIRSVLPHAKIGPFNQAGTSNDPDRPDHYDVSAHAARGTNYATGETGSAFDFASNSMYFIPRFNSSGVLVGVDPDERTDSYGQFWNTIEAESPGFAGIPRELHEFGILQTEQNLSTNEPGPRGAAQRFHTIVDLRERGLTGLWHWNVFDTFTSGGQSRSLLMSNGWMYLILEHMAGGESFRVPIASANTLGTKYRCLLSVKPHRTLLAISSFNVDRTLDSTATDRVSLRLPAGLVPDAGQHVWRMTILDKESDVYTLIRRDLETEGLLPQAFIDHPGEVVSSTGTMGGAAGRNFIAANWSRYEDKIKDSLRLKPFNGTITRDGADFVLEIDLPTPALLVLVMDKDSDGDGLFDAEKEMLGFSIGEADSNGNGLPDLLEASIQPADGARMLPALDIDPATGRPVLHFRRHGRFRHHAILLWESKDLIDWQLIARSLNGAALENLGAFRITDAGAFDWNDIIVEAADSTEPRRFFQVEVRNTLLP